MTTSRRKSHASNALSRPHQRIYRPLLECLEDRCVLSGLQLTPIGTYSTGLFAQGGAEIVAHDPETQRLFSINAGVRTVDILDIRNPTNPTLLKTIDTWALGSPNSVAVSRNVVAVAIENTNRQQPGFVAFYKTNGDFIHSLSVGAVPDMLTFTPDGNYLLVANGQSLDSGSWDRAARSLSKGRPLVPDSGNGTDDVDALFANGWAETLLPPLAQFADQPCQAGTSRSRGVPALSLSPSHFSVALAYDDPDQVDSSREA